MTDRPGATPAPASTDADLSALRARVSALEAENAQLRLQIGDLRERLNLPRTPPASEYPQEFLDSWRR